ncbi:hypothetical protein ACQQ2Q_19610 [Agrobacterium sp. ES01]|uniref:hypothetical protein n=1 Tax=Agrobacterium sp. ES01 TaxID=3420714 RepID=UPI003D152225
MRQQQKTFIIERKTSRKIKSDTGKPSIWGKLDLTVDQDETFESGPTDETVAVKDHEPR